MDNEEIVCYCSNVTRVQILNALANGAKTLGDIRQMTGACTIGKCRELNPTGKCCSPQIMNIIEQYEK